MESTNLIGLAIGLAIGLVIGLVIGLASLGTHADMSRAVVCNVLGSIS